MSIKVLDSQEGDGWKLYHADCVPVTANLPDSCMHLSAFSPPFASLYTYSASDRDFGNVTDHEQFFDGYKHLMSEMLRVTIPGRIMGIHCMALPMSKVRDGEIGLVDFPGMIISCAQRCRWIYHSDVVIWKDPVTAMQRTKALGLLWKQILKDSCMSRMGIPDRVVFFRKPGDNPERVTHKRGDFPVELWQKWASPIWDDIDQSDTLQFRSAREDADERHICPLQLEVTRRIVRLWSNPNDIVFSPFAGIGSEGYVALQEGRRFVGTELKESYYQQATRNLSAAVTKQGNVFE